MVARVCDVEIPEAELFFGDGGGDGEGDGEGEGEGEGTANTGSVGGTGVGVGVVWVAAEVLGTRWLRPK